MGVSWRGGPEVTPFLAAGWAEVTPSLAPGWAAACVSPELLLLGTVPLACQG